MQVVTRALVEQLEQAEAASVAATNEARTTSVVERLAAGVLVGSPGRPASGMAVGATLRSLDDEDVAGMLAWFDRHEVAPHVKLSAWAPPATVAAVGRAGLVPVAAHAMHAVAVDELPPAPQPPVEHGDRLVAEPVTAATVAEHTTVLVTGLRGDGRPPTASDHALGEADLADPAVTQVLVRRGGEVAGVGNVRVVGEVAHVSPAATRPAHRRRGVHALLLRERVRLAREAGARLAFVTAVADGPTPRNLERVGFRLVQHQWIVGRPDLAGGRTGGSGSGGTGTDRLPDGPDAAGSV